MNNKVVLKIVVICAAVFIVFGIIAAIFAVGTSWKEFYSEDRFSFGKGEPFEYHKNETFELNGITQIDIDTVSTDVVFYESDTELEITLDCKGYSRKESITLETDKNNNTITATVKYPDDWWIGINITDSLLSVGIPSDYDKNIKIYGVSGSIFMDSPLSNSFEEIKVSTVSGDLDINCEKANVLDFNSTSGSLAVQKTVIGSLYADTTSGDINVSNMNSAEGDIVIDTISGRVYLVYDILCKTRIDTVSGDVTLDIPNDSIIDLNYNSVSGDINGSYNANTAGVFIRVNTTSGDLNIN